MTWHHQIALATAKARWQSGDYVWLVVLRGFFLVEVFFAAVFFDDAFFDATFRFAGLASMAWCIGESDLAAPFGDVVVSNS